MVLGDKLGSAKLSDDDIQYLKGLFEHEYAGLLSYARCVLEDESHVEDLVQDVFLIATLKIKDVKESYSPKHWLYRTMKNLINNRRRELQRFRNAIGKMKSSITDVGDCGPAGFDSEILFFMSCQQYIKSTDWTLLCDYYLNGYNYHELSIRNGISESACKMRILRVKKILAKQLQKSGLYKARCEMNKEGGD